MKKLDYKSKKWDKEWIRHEKVYKQYFNDKMGIKLKKDDPIPNYRDVVVSFHTFKGSPKEQPYKELHELCSLNLKYEIISSKIYNHNQEDTSCIREVYLSGLVGVVGEALFNRLPRNSIDDFRKIEELTYGGSLYIQYSISLYKLIVTNQTHYSCFKSQDNIIVNLWNGEFEKASKYLDTIELITELEIGNMYYSEQRLKQIMISLIQRDEIKLKEELISRIRKYRQNGDGYLTAIDFVSIAFIKMAKKHGMNIEIDIIETPKFFFDDKLIEMELKKVEISPFIQEQIDKAKVIGFL